MWRSPYSDQLSWVVHWAFDFDWGRYFVIGWTTGMSQNSLPSASLEAKSMLARTVHRSPSVPWVRIYVTIAVGLMEAPNQIEIETDGHMRLQECSQALIQRHLYSDRESLNRQSVCVVLRLGRGSVISIATQYGLDSLGIESQWGSRFSAPLQTGPETYPAYYTFGTGSLSRDKVAGSCRPPIPI